MKKIFWVMVIGVVCVSAFAAEKTKAKPAPTALDVAVSKIVQIVGNTADEMKTTAKERAAIVWTLNAVMQASAAYQQYQ